MNGYDVDRHALADQLRALADGIDDKSVHLDFIDVQSTFGEADPIDPVKHSLTIGYLHTDEMDSPIIDRAALIDSE